MHILERPKGTVKRPTKKVQLVLRVDLRFYAFNHPGKKSLQLFVYYWAGPNVGKKRNIAIQLVLQQCCKTSCSFFVARFKSQVPTFFTQIGKEDRRSTVLPFYVDLRFFNPLPPPPRI